MDTRPPMPCRHLGRSGLQVSALSFGSWVTFGAQVDTGLAKECLTAAREGGVVVADAFLARPGGHHTPENPKLLGSDET